MTKYHQVNSLSIADCSYIAGLNDADGSITLAKKHRNENRQLIVSISNNEIQILNYVRLVTGAGHISKKRTYAEHHKINHTFKLTNRQALNLLIQITPFLRSHKKNRSELVLENYVELTPRNGKYTRELLARREIFIKKFHEIKPSSLN